MAQRARDNKIDFRRFVDWLRSQKGHALQNTLYRVAQEISPWELYRCDELITSMNNQPIDSIVRFALKNCTCEPYWPLRESATHMLASNHGVICKLEEDTEDAEDGGRRIYRDSYTLEDPGIVTSTLYRGDELRAVTIQYDYYVLPENATETETWTYRAVYEISTKGKPTYSEWRWPKDDPESSRAVKRGPTKLDVFPYLGVQWVDKRSLIEPIKGTILRYEAAYLNVAGDNDKHARRKQVYQGVTNFAKQREDRLESGEESIPKDATTYYPNTWPDGIKPMFDELQLLEDEIRDTTGAIKVKELHNASGISREIETSPLTAQALAVRERMQMLVAKVLPGAHLHMGPLTQLDPAQLNLTLKDLRDSWIEGVITDNEYITRRRMLTGFNETPNEGAVKLRPQELMKNTFTYVPMLPGAGIPQQGEA